MPRCCPGQTVRVFNQMTSESVECFVTSVREKQDRRFIGVGFAAPRGNFWHVVFPKAGTQQAVRSSQTGSLVEAERASNLPRKRNDLICQSEFGIAAGIASAIRRWRGLLLPVHLYPTRGA